MADDFLVLSVVPKDAGFLLQRYGWIPAIEERMVKVKLGKTLQGGGSIYDDRILTASCISEKYPLVTITHPYRKDQLTVPVRYENGACQNPTLGIAVMVPEFQPEMHPPNIGQTPMTGEFLILANPIKGIMPVRVDWSGPAEGAKRRGTEFGTPNDVNDGIPGSFVYNFKGEMVGAGIAYQENHTDRIIALSAECIECFFDTARIALG